MTNIPNPPDTLPGASNVSFLTHMEDIVAAWSDDGDEECPDCGAEYLDAEAIRCGCCGLERGAP